MPAEWPHQTLGLSDAEYVLKTLNVSVGVVTGKVYEVVCCENSIRCRDTPIQSRLYILTEYDWEKEEGRTIHHTLSICNFRKPNTDILLAYKPINFFFKFRFL